MKPFVIACEGIDGTGKSTFITELSKLFNKCVKMSKNNDLCTEKGIFSRFKKGEAIINLKKTHPEYNSGNFMKTKIIRDPYDGDIKDLHDAESYIANRETIYKKHLKDVDDIDIILLDRCFLSTIIYQKQLRQGDFAPNPIKIDILFLFVVTDWETFPDSRFTEDELKVKKENIERNNDYLFFSANIVGMTANQEPLPIEQLDLIISKFTPNVGLCVLVNANLPTDRIIKENLHYLYNVIY